MLFCSLKIDFKGLPVFMYAQFFCSRTCVQARHVILILHVLYQVIISNEIYSMCDALCDVCLPRSFCYFFPFTLILLFFFKFSF